MNFEQKYQNTQNFASSENTSYNPFMDENYIGINAYTEDIEPAYDKEYRQKKRKLKEDLKNNLKHAKSEEAKQQFKKNYETALDNLKHQYMVRTDKYSKEAMGYTPEENIKKKDVPKSIKSLVRPEERFTLTQTDKKKTDTPTSNKNIDVHDIETEETNKFGVTLPFKYNNELITTQPKNILDNKYKVKVRDDVEDELVEKTPQEYIPEKKDTTVITKKEEEKPVVIPNKNLQEKKIQTTKTPVKQPTVKAWENYTIPMLGVYFENDSQAKTTIDLIAKKLKENPNFTVGIVGEIYHLSTIPKDKLKIAETEHNGGGGVFFAPDQKTKLSVYDTAMFNSKTIQTELLKRGFDIRTVMTPVMKPYENDKNLHEGGSKRNIVRIYFMLK